MTEVVTYIRVNINGKWTNLGIVANESEIDEHFDFVEDLLNEKQRADECCKVIDNLGRCAKLQEEKIDRLEKRWSELRERLNASFENSEYFLEGFGFSDVLKLMQQLEEDNNARSK
ncbi:hypothetical protein LAU42_07200 [Macrococcus armenti]|uniref:hypothetical protein n=1 Tax=Macrococcus armenti TaxID=2875764 RepID=UPI001CCDE0FC|nr:hypothetical protein [Macrococcus armenti]UBH21582.1 hypothetical protein LAU42_07200 [Macrococcus armenti]